MKHDLATVWGVGYLPWAPGTWGSLAALGPGFMLIWIGGNWLLIPGIIAVTIAGVWASQWYAEEFQKDDAGEIVIDEVAGQWVALLPASLAITDILIAFIFFRAADIFKPWPVNWADQRIPGGIGVMADDLIAGVYAAVGLFALKQVFQLAGLE